jgi:hypothetical protein
MNIGRVYQSVKQKSIHIEKIMALQNVFQKTGTDFIEFLESNVPI